MASTIVTRVGGGGVPLTAPESIVIGNANYELNPFSYTVPAGKLAVVTVMRGSHDFTIDEGSGAETYLKAGGPFNVYGQGTTGGHVQPPVYAYTADRDYSLTGTITLQAPTGEGYQGGFVYAGSTLIATVPFASGSPLVYNITDFQLLNGEQVYATNLVTWFASGGTTYMTLNADTPFSDDTDINLKFNLREGVTITGGNFVAEIYSV